MTYLLGVVTSSSSLLCVMCSNYDDHNTNENDDDDVSDLILRITISVSKHYSYTFFSAFRIMQHIYAGTSYTDNLSRIVSIN